MNYLIVSDIHGAKENFLKLVQFYSGQLAGILFAGDGLEAMHLIKEPFSIYGVKGNMDHSHAPVFQDFYLEKIHVAITHGHLFEVKQGLLSLKKRLLPENYDLVVFGHTHRQHQEKEGKTVFFNPGAFQKGEYGLLTVLSSDFHLSFETL